MSIIGNHVQTHSHTHSTLGHFRVTSSPTGMFLQSRRKPEKTHAGSNLSSGLTRTILSLQIKHVSFAKSHDQQFSSGRLQTVDITLLKERRACNVSNKSYLPKTIINQKQSFANSDFVLQKWLLSVFCHQFVSIIQVLDNDIFPDKSRGTNDCVISPYQDVKKNDTMA